MNTIPNKVEELVLRAQTLEEKGKLIEAEEILKTAVEVDPTFEPAWNAY